MVKYTTRYVELQRVIAMGCAISPVLFVMVIEGILRGLKPEYCFLQNEVKIWAFMDDLTVIQDNRKVAQLVLERLVELVKWGQKASKSRRSRSLSMKGGSVINEVFSIAGEKIPTARCEESWEVV